MSKHEHDKHDPIIKAVDQTIVAALRHLADQMERGEPATLLLAYVNTEKNTYEAAVRGLPHDVLAMLFDLDNKVRQAHAKDMESRRTTSYQGYVTQQREIALEILDRVKTLEGRIDDLEGTSIRSDLVPKREAAAV